MPIVKRAGHKNGIGEWIEILEPYAPSHVARSRTLFAYLLCRGCSHRLPFQLPLYLTPRRVRTLIQNWQTLSLDCPRMSHASALFNSPTPAFEFQATAQPGCEVGFADLANQNEVKVGVDKIVTASFQPAGRAVAILDLFLPRRNLCENIKEQFEMENRPPSWLLKLDRDRLKARIAFGIALVLLEESGAIPLAKRFVAGARQTGVERLLDGEFELGVGH